MREPMGKGWMKLVVLFAAAVLLLVTHAIMPHRWSDPRVMAGMFEDLGLGGGAGFLLAAGVLTFAGVPRLLFFGLGGWLFGWGEGFTLALAASLIGSAASFWLLRWIGRDWLVDWFGGEKFMGRITGVEPKIVSVFMVRQLPVSNLILNAGLAMSRVKSPAFIIGSALGFIPQGVAAALIGSGAAKDSVSQGATRLGIAAVVAVSAGFFVWYVRTRKEVVR